MLPTQLLCMFQSKKFCPSCFQFSGYRSQMSFFLHFNLLFEVWLLFQVPHPIAWQKYLSFSNAVFNSASIDPNFVKVRQTEEEISYCFLLAPSPFSANLLKFSFSVFPDSSGRVTKISPVPDDAEKLEGTFKKKIQSIPLQELPGEQKQKKHFI